METIVLCGSMKVKESIIALGQELESIGYKVLLPEECIAGLPKEIASRAHINRIIDANTDKVLIVNNRKGDIDNYIGPNSFAEIAFSFYYNKPIYLLNDIYEPYKDELIGWHVNTLKGDINNL